MPPSVRRARHGRRRHGGCGTSTNGECSARGSWTGAIGPGSANQRGDQWGTHAGECHGGESRLALVVPLSLPSTLLGYCARCIAQNPLTHANARHHIAVRRLWLPCGTRPTTNSARLWRVRHASARVHFWATVVKGCPQQGTLWPYSWPPLATLGHTWP